MTLFDRLAEVRDAEYREFQIKLVPNIPPETILGVRTPDMRRIAKEVFASESRDAFLASLPHRCYEENLIHFFVLAMIKDFDECVRGVEAFLPYVDCWPVSDQATPKAFRKDHARLLPYVKKWIASDRVYTARFGLRMLMNEFLGDDFDEEYLELAASVPPGEYYLDMMAAWFFATALAKRYDETVPYFENRLLDERVMRKAIQKAVESYRVTGEHKEYLKTLRQDPPRLRSFQGGNMNEYRYVTLREAPELEKKAAEWFHGKWGVPEEAYLECMDEYLSGETEYGWYLCLCGDAIVGGLGVIENDFHDRKDLYPNVCAVYTDEAHRCRGIAGRLLDMAVEDLRSKGVSPVYLLTDHTGFYERYGWEFYCKAQGDGEETPSRLYIHR